MAIRAQWAGASSIARTPLMTIPPVTPSAGPLSPLAYCLLPTAYCLLPTACRQEFKDDEPGSRRGLAGRAGRIRPSRRRRGRRRGWADRAGLRRRRPARLPALGGQGAAGPAADRERRRRPSGLERKGDRARLRLALGRGRARRVGERDAREGRARRKRPRMRRALAAGRGGGPRARPRRPKRRRAAQQLLGQARRLRLPRLRVGNRSEGLRRAGSSGPARSHGGDRGRDAGAARRGDPRDRRLLDPDLRHSASRAGARLRALRDGEGALAAAREGGGADFEPRWPRIRPSSRGRGGSTPR